MDWTLARYAALLGLVGVCAWRVSEWAKAAAWALESDFEDTGGVEGQARRAAELLWIVARFTAGGCGIVLATGAWAAAWIGWTVLFRLRVYPLWLLVLAVALLWAATTLSIRNSTPLNLDRYRARPQRIVALEPPMPTSSRPSNAISNIALVVLGLVLMLAASSGTVAALAYFVLG
ncbi:MAG: hypothetical protein AB7O67_07565 [Vicinamibacterales bacterium]